MVEEEFDEREGQEGEQEDSPERKKRPLQGKSLRGLRQDLTKKLDQALKRGIIPDDHPVWKDCLRWLKALGEKENRKRRDDGLPPVMDASQAAEEVIQQIRQLYSKEKLSAVSVLNDSETLLFGLLHPSVKRLEQKVLEKWKELEKKAAQGSPDVELCYNDAFRMLSNFLFVKATIYVKSQKLSLDHDDVGTAVSKTLYVVWSKHKNGKATKAEHIVNLAKSVLLKEYKEDEKDSFPSKIEKIKTAKSEQWARNTSIEEPMSRDEEGKEKKLEDILKNEQQVSPETNAIFAREVECWDKKLEEREKDNKIAKELAKRCMLMALRLYLRREICYSIVQKCPLLTRLNNTNSVVNDFFDDFSKQLVHVGGNSPRVFGRFTIWNSTLWD